MRQIEIKYLCDEITFGKYRGLLFRDLPSSYLKWAMENEIFTTNNPDVKYHIENKMKVTNNYNPDYHYADDWGWGDYWT